MLDNGKDSVIIDRIRRAGLDRVKAMAARSGRAPERITQDVCVLSAVAVSGIYGAIRKCRVSRQEVWGILDQYGAYAQVILDSRPRPE